MEWQAAGQQAIRAEAETYYDAVEDWEEEDDDEWYDADTEIFYHHD